MNTGRESLDGEHHQCDRGAYCPSPEEIAARCEEIKAFNLECMKEGVSRRSAEYSRRVKQLNHRRGRNTFGV